MPRRWRVTTGQASAIGATGATIAGTVNPEGLETSYVFEYGTAPTSLTSSTPTAQAGAGSTAVPVTAVLSGLTPNDTYYYALVATNSSGPDDGELALFTTGSAPAPPGQARNGAPPLPGRPARGDATASRYTRPAE